MITVIQQEEPASFQLKVRQPGKLAIAELVGEKPTRKSGKRFEKKADQREEIPASEFPPCWRELG